MNIKCLEYYVNKEYINKMYGLDAELEAKQQEKYSIERENEVRVFVSIYLLRLKSI